MAGVEPLLKQVRVPSLPFYFYRCLIFYVRLDRWSCSHVKTCGRGECTHEVIGKIVFACDELELTCFCLSRGVLSANDTVIDGIRAETKSVSDRYCNTEVSLSYNHCCVVTTRINMTESSLFQMRAAITSLAEETKVHQKKYSKTFSLCNCRYYRWQKVAQTNLSGLTSSVSRTSRTAWVLLCGQVGDLMAHFYNA